ncbi:hypothetical protein [Micromonospora coxensis]|uniref:Uncharacterized protein n=1 Tax=Micromonospora coxensis TaxID=356852 RepID=A0A1C5GWL2_9ACTN|nr:hypothetical protein [Micromonospora coxensis]SCG38189.1 hypothetical protein GA0070614_0485 [Micromonospora coxensis]
MDQWTLQQADQWLDWVHDHHDEFGYRYVYFAYLAVRAGEPRHGEIIMTVEPDGSVVLRAGSLDRGLRLATDAERTQFADHLRQRYCGDRYLSMSEWEAAQHADFLEEAEWRYGP